jgi:catechol 2,3-dioxygenase-like lactoylglutathione lyase family enzyme
MRQRVDLVTLGVPDVEAAHRFYVDGLGWQPTLVVPGEIVFIQIGHGLMLGLFGAADLAADIGAPLAAAPAPMSLAQVVDTEDEVVRIIERARAIGAEILKEPQKAAFGGFHGYFADPAGFRWEIATNPGWSVAPDGTVTLVPIGN